MYLALSVFVHNIHSFVLPVQKAYEYTLCLSSGSVCYGRRISAFISVHISPLHTHCISTLTVWWLTHVPCLCYFQAWHLWKAGWMQEGGGRERVNKRTARVRCGVGSTPVETCKNETRRSAASIGRSYMHSCFKMLHSESNVHHADCCPKSSQMCKNGAFWKQRKAFYSACSIKDEEISIAMVTHNPFLFYP